MFGGKLRLRSALLSLVCVLFLARTGTVVTAQVRHTQQPSVTHPLFDFHSNFWVNLHQTLLEEALLRAGKPDRRLQSTTPLVTSQMSSLEQSNWNAAVTFYATHFQTRELFDDELIAINDALAEQPDDGRRLSSTDLSPPLVVVLSGAAPIFRKYWWPAQRHSNMKWIASQRERVHNLGPRLAAAMTRDLRQSWPATAIHVDVCYYVLAFGHAYTMAVPPHITYASADPSQQGLTGFELLFHEASHTFANVEKDALASACRAQGKDCGQLWHALLFYTSGVELGRLLPAGEQASFTPYAHKEGVYTRGEWPRYLRVLATDWQAYHDGKMSFDAAIQNMATDFQ